MPPIPAIVMSIKTRSGRRERTSTTASSPEVASATRSKSSVTPRTHRAALRNGAAPPPTSTRPVSAPAAPGRGRRGKSVGQSAVEEKRRVNALRQLSHTFQRLAHVVPDPLEQFLRLAGVGVGELAGQLEVDGERNEVLLNAVVQIALDPAALGVRRCDHARSRGAKLLDLNV